MTTYPLRVMSERKTSWVSAFLYIASATAALVEIFEEAQAMARAADKRYPFAEG